MDCTPESAPRQAPRSLPLLPNHLADLQRSGLTDSTIAAAGVYSETDHRKLAGILNRKTWPRTWGAGLVFPFHDESGTVVLNRVKPDHPPTKAGKATKYVQPSGVPIRAYIPAGLNGELQNVERVALLTEGEKKTLAGAQAGFVAIGLTGVDCWHPKKSSALLPDLERVEWNGRRVFVAFDSDAAVNENVETNERLLAAALKARGAAVRVARFPPGPEGAKVGLDDFLVAHGAAELWKLLDSAEEPEAVDAALIKQPAADILPEDEARRIIHANQQDGVSRLVRWRDEWWWWGGGRYRERSDAEVSAEVTESLNRSWLKVTRHAVGDVLAQLRAQTILPGATDPPAWRGKAPVDRRPGDLLPARNGIFHLPAVADGKTPYQLPPTPRLFCTSALDFPVALDAPKPERWLQFTRELWPDDAESIACLQEVFGYLLSGDTSQQKIFVLISPKRGGKGTIAHVLRGLVGAENFCGPTLASLAGPFGLQALVGRSVAVIPDARLSGRTDKAVVTERLLAISGEDTLTVDRKCLPSIHAKLPTRFVILSNEIPRLADASGTIASRLVALRMTRSWYGAEDPGLTQKLLAELPGILLWTIGGWARLRQRGHFQQPTSGAALVREVEELASPVGAFVKQCCIVGLEHQVSRQDLFDAYLEWCKSEGKIAPADAATFGRDLRAVVSALEDRQHRADGNRLRTYVGIGLRAGF